MPAEEFRLSVIAMDKNQRVSGAPSSQRGNSSLHGRTPADNRRKNEDDAMEIQKGASVLVPAAAGAYQIRGSGVCYKAGIPV
ncbi:MAG: hypothetical protein R2860_11790 [Desulfobacterales bacterium]